MIPGLMRGLKISAEGTERELVVERAQMVPRGTAVLTSSGALAKTGIAAIIHAATGAMTRGGGPFEPTLESIACATRNSLLLAEDAGFSRVGLPFLGGALFAARIGAEPEAIAQAIVETALEYEGDLEVVFVVMGAANVKIFQELAGTRAEVVEASLTDFSAHRAPAIVNAANMELQFGGGLSGAIGSASRAARDIEREAQSIVREFYEN